MPPPTPLHASERKLGWFMLVAIPLTMVWWLRSCGVSDVSTIAGILGRWVWRAWHLVWEGGWSRMSPNDVFYLLLVGALGSAVVLAPWHLLYLCGQRRRTPPRALWWWSALYGLIPAGVASIFLPFIISESLWRTASDRRFGIFILGEFALGLAITVLGFRAWRRRRREDRAALAADPAS